ncbi:MAG: PAS domain-containing protein [Thermodesulfobacteria bacterium]|nr:PAS domain-containing protein [Thermodesulfobacteriota bacterium]
MESSKTSQRIFEETLDKVQEGILVVDDQFRVIHFNQAAERILGAKKEEVLHRPCYKVFEKHIEKELCILIKQQLAKGNTIYQFPLYFRDQPEKVIYLNAYPLKENEKIVSIVVILNEKIPPVFVDDILNSLGEALFIVDSNFKVSVFNNMAEMLTGYSAKEALGKYCDEVFKTNICGEGCILLKSIKEKRTIKRSGIFMTRADGTHFPVEITASPLFVKGELVGGLEIFRDISFEVQMQTILENIGDGVFSVDNHFHIICYNPALERITGYKATEALGKPCQEVFRSELCNKECPVALAISEGKKISNKFTYFQHKSGRKIPVSITVAPIRDSEGRLLGAVETVRDLTEILSLRKELNKDYRLGDIISKSPKIKRILDILPDIAESESTVLITGESGTGKEIFARAIHDLSPRRDGPFVAVNCAAIPDTLLESELFGYKAGAFTDAKKDKPGRFALAQGGTLFLDEIGEIPASLQVKLLRVLETKEYEPLGASRPEKADVRIIAATNQDLEKLVEAGRFRQDLFYRLNVARIHLPPLRERKEDIPLLVEYFIQKFRASKGRNIIGITEEALKILLNYDFPGNVRELENIIEYCFIVCKEGLIYPEHLPEYLYQPEEEESTISFSKPMTLEEIEKIAILQALKRNKWKKLATCRELGISKDTLRRKLKKYGISLQGAH